MTEHAVSALSPLDGRYAAKLASLRPLMSEQGFMHRRVQVEITWLLALSDSGMAELKPFSAEARTFLVNLIHHFSSADALAIKEIEKTTNHDVKAVEYWLKAQCQAASLAPQLQAEFAAALEFIHFACTSEDINNTSHALQLKAMRAQVLLPGIDALQDKLRAMAHQYADHAMLSRTHGQTASPTTVGKELANVLMRVHTARQRIAQVPLLAKMNGAVGNHNAHVSARADCKTRD
jgi:adenylosuccinate lyase